MDLATRPKSRGQRGRSETEKRSSLARHPDGYRLPRDPGPGGGRRCPALHRLGGAARHHRPVDQPRGWHGGPDRGPHPACASCRSRGYGSIGCGSGRRIRHRHRSTADFVWSEIELDAAAARRGPLYRDAGRARGHPHPGLGRRRAGACRLAFWRAGRSRDWAIENLTVAQLLVTTQVPRPAAPINSTPRVSRSRARRCSALGASRA